MEETQKESASFLHKEKEDYFLKNLEKKRWGILIAIFFYTFTNQGTWCTYGPIVTPTQSYYNIDYTTVNWFVYTFYITYTLFSFPGSYMLYNHFALSIIMGSLVNAIGSWMRYFAKENFAMALSGQFIMGISFCVILEAPILVSQRWFHYRERFFVVTTLVLASSLGSGLGFLVPALVVKDDPNRVETILLIEAICCSISIPFLVFLRNKPKVAPNFAESVERPSFWESFKALMKNPKYNMAMMAFGTLYGNAWDLFSILGNLVDPDKISNETIGWTGAIAVGVSAFASFGINYTLNSCKNSLKYIDPMLKFLFTIGFLAFIAFSLTIQYQNSVSLYIIMTVLGLSAISVTPLCCTCLEELSFPVPESLSINFMFFTSNLFSLGISMLVTLPEVDLYGTWILVGTLAPFYFYLMFWYKTDFKKTEQEGAFASFGKLPEQEKPPVPEQKTIINEDNVSDNDQDTMVGDFQGGALDLSKIKLI